jgi:hypothetical protein
MAKPKKIDGVIEVVRYGQDGEVLWVRAYERRGPTFSDLKIIHRGDLIDRIKDGEIFYAGRRVPLNASTFEMTAQVRVVTSGDQDYLVTSNGAASADDLSGIPSV